MRFVQKTKGNEFIEEKTMRYIKIEGGTGYCGQDFEEYLHTDMSDRELDVLCAEKAYDNAKQYEYTVWGWGIGTAESYAEENEVTVEEAEQMMEDYYADAYADWEEITEEEYEKNK